jgi:outer membrane protein TolC
MSDVEVKYSVMKAYYQAEAAQEAKSLLTEILKPIDKLLSDTRATFAQGLIEETDVNRIELAQANLQSQINMQNRLSDVALANLKFQMGLPLDGDIILKDKLADLKAEVSLAAESKFDASKRVEYQLLETGIRLKEYDMRQKRVQYFPSLYGLMNYSWNSQTEKMGDFFKSSIDAYGRKVNSWYDQGFVGLSLKVPIFDSGLKLAQIKQAKIEQLKTKNDFENFKNASQLQFMAAQSTLTSAVADEILAQKTLDLSQKIFNRNKIKFTHGAGSSFELEQSEQDYVTNQLKQVQSVMNLLNANADMDKALGK